MHTSPLRHATAVLAGLLVITACTDSNETPPEESHTPASAALVVDGTAAGDPILLIAGTAQAVEVKFYHDDGDEITDIEADHFARITFSPTTLATVADVPNQHFHKTVTGGAELGSGTVTIGYGHDEAADQLTFGPFAVTVVAAAQ